MGRISSVLVGIGLVFGMIPNALACCNYGCCDCSCVASVPEPNAEDIMKRLSEVLRSNRIDPQSLDLVVRTRDKTVVLHQSENKKVEQPVSGGE